MKKTWDPGDMGCGQFVFELSRRVLALEANEQLEVIARDRGAVTDIPAWCRMTGHTLVSAKPPRYLLERKKT